MKKFLNSKYLTFPAIGLTLVVIICIGVLAGWLFDISTLKAAITGSVAVNPVTALTFIVGSLALHLLNDWSTKWRQVGTALGVAVASVGIVRLLEIVANLSTGISEWLFSRKLIMEEVPNIMAPNTAFCFVLMGMSLLCYSSLTTPIRKISSYLSLIVLLIALFSIVGYLYNAPEFYNVRSHIPMAFATALSFFIFSLCTIFRRRDNYLSTFLQSPLAGSRMARFLLPFAALIPIFTGKLRIYGQENSLYSSEFGTSLFTLVTIILFALLIWRSALIINRANIRLHQEIQNTKIVSEQLHMEQKKEFERLKLHDRIQQHKILISATINAQEREKKQIGMELHDHINQILASTKMYIDSARTDENMRDELLQKSREQLTYAIDEIRNMSRSMVLYNGGQGGIHAQIVELFQNMSAASKIRISNNIDQEAYSGLQSNAQVALFRIMEEQLNNIVKYARAGSVIVTFRQDHDEFHLRIKDDGKGFNVNQTRRGIGLSNIATRAEFLNGRINIDSSPGMGCTLDVYFREE